MPEYLTTAEVANLCRTSPETVRYWRHVGSGPASFKCGRRVLYDAKIVTEWLRGLQEEANGGKVA
ncbi:helix-turn-helix domain-containing protein [Amycolatopsis sp. NBC_00438]|uniref:helix-turn-helix domain-containing protein n=1 Tax=Amycolatopsis sp. NBC_00438 TaxID=2903558 RepID=UPI002E1E3710